MRIEVKLRVLSYGLSYGAKVAFGRHKDPTPMGDLHRLVGRPCLHK